MSSLLALAQDFLDRMSNPAYGAAVNEEYAMKFAHLLNDERFEAELNEQIGRLDDPDALSSHAWLWVIGWAKSQGVAVQEDVLVKLFDGAANVALKTMIIELVVDNIGERETQQAGASLDSLKPFFGRVIRDAVGMREAPLEPGLASPVERTDVDESQPSMARAEGLLVALLQVGTPETLAAASVLLPYRWPGQDQLREFFERELERLEPDTRDEWLQRMKRFS